MCARCIDVVIIHHNTLDITRRCIESLYATAQHLLERVVLVDNASTDGSGEQLANEFPFVEYVKLTTPQSYATACNYGARCGSAPFIVLSNSDVEYTNDAIEQCVAYMNHHPSVAVTGPQQYYPNGTLQRSWGYLPGWSEVTHLLSGGEWFRNRCPRRISRPYAVPYLDGAVMVTRRNAFEEIGGMDERFAFFGEDVDLCFRFWQHGWHCMLIPYAQVIHLRGATRKRDTAVQVSYELQNMAAKLQFIATHGSPTEKWLAPKAYIIISQIRQLFYCALRIIRLLPKDAFQERFFIDRAIITYLRTQQKSNGPQQHLLVRHQSNS